MNRLRVATVPASVASYTLIPAPTALPPGAAEIEITTQLLIWPRRNAVSSPPPRQPPRGSLFVNKGLTGPSGVDFTLVEEEAYPGVHLATWVGTAASTVEVRAVTTLGDGDLYVTTSVTLKNVGKELEGLGVTTRRLSRAVSRGVCACVCACVCVCVCACVSIWARGVHVCGV